MAFLKDPKGPPLWEEDPGAKDVVHIDNEKVIYSPLVLMDARASWFLGVWRRGAQEPARVSVRLRPGPYYLMASPGSIPLLTGTPR